MKLFGIELFGKKRTDEASASHAPVAQNDPPLPDSGAGWYIATDTERRLKQVVFDLPNSKAVPSEFGSLMLPGKYRSLLSSSWVCGLFRMHGKSAPCLLIRADDDIDEFKTNPTRIAFSFFKTQSGGVLGVYIYVDSQALRAKRSQAHVFIEMSNGLDVPEYVQLVKDAIKSDSITVVLAGGGGSMTSVMNASGESQSFSPPQCRYDINLCLELSCREVMWRELKELLALNASLAPEQRSYTQSMDEVRKLMSATQNPLLQQPT